MARILPVLLSAAAVCQGALISVAQQPAESPVLRDGLSVNQPAAYQGYSLIAPMMSTSTYLIDMEGRVVKQWNSDCTPALSAYLLPNGHLLRPGSQRGARPGGPGAGGCLQEFDWDGNLVWDFSFHDQFPHSTLQPHHDICPLPNGHVLLVCSDPKTKEEIVAAGRLPELATGPMQSESIIEIKPVGERGGEIVWQWHAWDHLIQDVQEHKPDYGDVAEHPERIDINFTTGMMDRMLKDPQQLARLRSLGYVSGGSAAGSPDQHSARDARSRAGRPGRPQTGHGGVGGPAEPAGPGLADGGPGGEGPGLRGPGAMGSDWLHVNSVAYNARFDQVMISVHELSEVWIIDHSTTTAQAASHTGGKSGKGGDLLYRWGNPRVYRSGTNADQRLFAQHCAHWISEGLPGEGHMLVFNNGMHRPDGDYSSADEIVLPVDSNGSYFKEEYVAYEPFDAAWRYGSPDNTAFFSMLISGCQRLPNGNTFICSGNQNLLFEVTPDREVVWQYKLPGGSPPGPHGPPGPGRESGLLPGFLAAMLGINDTQQKELEALQQSVDTQLHSLLTSDQREQLKPAIGPPGPGPRGGPAGFGAPTRFRSPPPIGQVIPDDVLGDLALSAQQKTAMTALQKQVTSRLNGILTTPQRQQIADMERMIAQRGGPGFGPPGFGPPGFGPPPAMGPGGGGGGIFRAYRYGPEYPGLKGRELTPGRPLEEVLLSTGA